MRGRGLPAVSRRQALVALGIATVAFAVALELTDPGGAGIIGFEFAGSSARAAEIMAEWGAHGRHLARVNLLLDYGYMLSYGLFFALAGFAVRDASRERGRRRMASAGRVVPYFALAAACFDAVENVALLLVLGGQGGSFLPPFATACSTVKLSLIGLAVVYVVCGALLWFRDRLLRPA